MRRLAFAFAVMTGIGASTALLPCGNEALAQAGCCMQRAASKDEDFVFCSDNSREHRVNNKIIGSAMGMGLCQIVD